MSRPIGSKNKKPAEGRKTLYKTFSISALPEEAEQIKSDIERECEFKEIQIMPMKGLCSYYAWEKGLIICH